jgi:tetratricopeptide (TPR) repeat protein
LATPTQESPRQAETPGREIPLQGSRRLSRSILWDLQSRFFHRQAVLAWSEGTVPQYITSTPLLAGAYARVVHGWLRDGLAGDSPAIDRSRPVHILDLGAGSGRFAYRFLKLFHQPGGDTPGVTVRYVMTDRVARNLEFWRDHPSFQPFLAAGRLDFARFDTEEADGQEEIRLLVSGEVLPAGGAGNPLVVFANYFFDGIPQDAFVIGAGALQERLVSLGTPGEEPDPDDPALLSRVRLGFEDRRVSSLGYYGEPDLDRILEEYARDLPGGTALLFPCAALRCVRRLAAVSGGRLLLLSADKGYHRAEDLAGREEPEIEVHGSFSMMVNYHAIGRYFLHQGGEALHPPHGHSHLDVSAFLSAAPAGGYPETRRAYREAVGCWGPDDFFTLRGGLDRLAGSLSLEQRLSFLQLSGWDDAVLTDAFPTLLRQVADAPEALRQRVRQAIERVWELYLPIGEEGDLAFSLGALLYEMFDYPGAIAYFERSLRLHGPAASTSYNLGACYYGLRRMDDALRHVEEALALDPSFESAAAMRLRIQSETGPGEAVSSSPFG